MNGIISNKYSSPPRVIKISFVVFAFILIHINPLYGYSTVSTVRSEPVIHSHTNQDQTPSEMLSSRKQLKFQHNQTTLSIRQGGHNGHSRMGGRVRMASKHARSASRRHRHRQSFGFVNGCWGKEQETKTPKPKSPFNLRPTPSNKKNRFSQYVDFNLKHSTRASLGQRFTFFASTRGNLHKTSGFQQPMDSFKPTFSEGQRGRVSVLPRIGMEWKGPFLPILSGNLAFQPTGLLSAQPQKPIRQKEPNMLGGPRMGGYGHDYLLMREMYNLDHDPGGLEGSYPPHDLSFGEGLGMPYGPEGIPIETMGGFLYGSDGLSYGDMGGLYGNDHFPMGDMGAMSPFSGGMMGNSFGGGMGGYGRMRKRNQAVYGGKFLVTLGPLGHGTFFIGQKYALMKNPASPHALTKDQPRFSDYVGHVEANLLRCLRVNAHFDVDQKSFQSRVSGIGGSIYMENANFSVNYRITRNVMKNFGRPVGRPGNRNLDKIRNQKNFQQTDKKINYNFTYQFTDNWSLRGSLMQNLEGAKERRRQFSYRTGVNYNFENFGIGFTVSQRNRPVIERGSALKRGRNVRGEKRKKTFKKDTCFMITLSVNDEGEFMSPVHENSIFSLHSQ